MVLLNRLLNPFLNILIKVITRLDPEALTPLKPHTNKIIGIEILTFSKTLYFKIQNNEIIYVKQLKDEHVANTVVRGQLKDFIQLAVKPGTSATSPANTKIHLQGDMTLAEACLAVLKQMDLDWEGELSNWVGDGLAIQISSISQKTFAWAKKNIKHRGQDLADYFQFEAHYLPSLLEVDEFSKAVDTLRHDTDRLNDRLQRFKRNLVNIS